MIVPLIYRSFLGRFWRTCLDGRENSQTSRGILRSGTTLATGRFGRLGAVVGFVAQFTVEFKPNTRVATLLG